MDIELVEAGKEELEAIREMSRLFRYDLSEFKGMPCDESGMFAPIPNLDNFLEEGNHAFTIRYKKELAGFALIEGNKVEQKSFIFSYLFILRKFRRTGLGKIATIQILNKFRGDWKIDYNTPNTTAMEFWDNIIDAYTGGKYSIAEQNHEKWGPLKVIKFSNLLTTQSENENSI